MKIFFRILLVIAIAAMSYLCVMSIVTPIEFEKTQTFREKAIISHLIQIRKAQVEYKNQFDHFTASGDTLIDFIKNGQVPVVLKEGTLTDEQLKNGLTEEKAMKIINKGNKKEIEANGLVGFRRDTSYVSVYESLFADEFPKAYGHALTLKSIRMLLSNEKRTVKQMINNGIITEKDAEPLIENIEERADEVNSFSHTIPASILRWMFFVRKKKEWK